MIVSMMPNLSTIKKTQALSTGRWLGGEHINWINRNMSNVNKETFDIIKAVDVNINIDINDKTEEKSIESVEVERSKKVWLVGWLAICVDMEEEVEETDESSQKKR